MRCPPQEMLPGFGRHRLPRCTAAQDCLRRACDKHDVPTLHTGPHLLPQIQGLAVDVDSLNRLSWIPHPLWSLTLLLLSHYRNPTPIPAARYPAPHLLPQHLTTAPPPSPPHLLPQHKGLAVDVDYGLLSHVDPQRMDALGGVGAGRARHSPGG